MLHTLNQCGLFYERDGNVSRVATYLLRIMVASLLCAIVKHLAGDKTSIGKTVGWMCGLFLCFTLVSPLVTIKIQNLDWFWEDSISQGEEYAQAGNLQAREELCSIIISRSEAYILDKANSYGANLTVEVTLDSAELPTPKSVTISGNISPYGKRQLQNAITQELGIPLEEQTWT